MIELVFTIDYEIFGNGEGSLGELVHEPASELKAIFDERGELFVVFVEAAEMEMIERHGTDKAVGLVQQQVRDLYESGYEIGLHLHPQWYNARYEGGKWRLDYSEYNLCIQSEERIAQIVDRSIAYLRRILGDAKFAPFSFRAGNWLIQPTRVLANVLAERGVKVDSSVFKGGRQYQHGLDFRPALKNGYCWPFSDDVNVPSPRGRLWEFPTYTKMVPLWEMISAKRVGLQSKGPAKSPSFRHKLYRFLDFLHFFHPLKLDFCRMTAEELKRMLDSEIRKDSQEPSVFRPIVAIGHTKDLIDFETTRTALRYARQHGIKISTFGDVYRRALGTVSGPATGG
jgi:hypothetical protein